MAVIDKPAAPGANATAAPATPALGPDGQPIPAKRSPGHRGADVKDTVAEMAAKAHEISLEAGSKMAAAMKDVVNGAAGITGFVVESARDLVQFMVRRGQMTQEEADKLMREAEDYQSKRKPRASAPSKSAKPAKPQGKTTSSHKPAKSKPPVKAKKPAKPAAKAKPKAKAKSSAKPAKAKKR